MSRLRALSVLISISNSPSPKVGKRANGRAHLPISPVSGECHRGPVRGAARLQKRSGGAASNQGGKREDLFMLPTAAHPGPRRLSLSRRRPGEKRIAARRDRFGLPVSQVIRPFERPGEARRGISFGSRFRRRPSISAMETGDPASGRIPPARRAPADLRRPACAP